MRATKITILSILLSSISAFVLSDISPFIPVLDDWEFLASNNISNPDSELSSNDILGKELRKRGSCPANYNSCSTLAAADAGSCCTKNSICSLDAANQVACCPTGAVCTGTISIPTTTTTVTTSTGGFVLGGTTASSTPFTTATTTTTSPPTTTSFLSNSFFPFPVIPSTYPNSVACLSAYSACQTNYAHCTADLQGGSFGVTISAANGGTTVEASTGTLSLGLASATSICMSLSSVACLNIRSTQCAQFGSATATTTVGFVTGTNGAGGVGCGGLGYAVVAAVAGVAGVLV